MKRLAYGLGVALLCLVAAHGQAREASADLARAVKFFDNFEDQRAAALLAKVLKESTAPEQVARAHIYLGLIALNALKSDKARAEFKSALVVDATAELPFEAAPKARLIYDQARKEVEQEAQRELANPSHKPEPIVVQAQPVQPVVVVGSDTPPGPAPSPVEPTPVEKEKPPPPPPASTPAVAKFQGPEAAPPGPHYGSAIALMTLGAAALVGGGVVGAISRSTLNSANTNGDVGMSTALASQAGTQGLVADICFGAGGLGLATGIIVLLVQANSGHSANTAMHATSNGVAFAF